MAPAGFTNGSEALLADTVAKGEGIDARVRTLISACEGSIATDMATGSEITLMEGRLPDRHSQWEPRISAQRAIRRRVAQHQASCLRNTTADSVGLRRRLHIEAGATLPAGHTLEVRVAGVAGVPSNADVVVLDMTAVNAVAPGFATPYPCGQPRPEASRPGVGGKVGTYSYATIDVLADVADCFPVGSGYTPILNPTRILDTRNGIGV